MKKAALLVFVTLLTACQLRPTPEIVRITVPVEVTVLVTQPPLPTYTPYSTYTPYPTYTLPPVHTNTPVPLSTDTPLPSTSTETLTSTATTTPPPLTPTPPTPPTTWTPVITTTVSPQSAALPNCPNPRARLTYPTVNAVLKGVVEIRGSAYIDNFDYYKFEFRHKGATDWSFVQRFKDTVADGLLGVWDTSSFPAGGYFFRLVVVDKTGNYPPPCEVEVTIEH